MARRLRVFVGSSVFALLAFAAACGADDAPPANAVSQPDAGVDAASSVEAGGVVPTLDGASTTPDGSTTTPARYRDLRGVLHVHSALSHDACDGKGIDNGVPNAPCIDELRAAPCKAGLDFVMLTDHPAHMQDYEPLKNLHYDATKGDELVNDASGSPVANLMKCSDGRKVMFTFGYESTHTLPMGFNKHPTQFDRYTNDRPLADVKALVADLKAAGALVGLAHSEEDDLSADLIVEGGAEVMEWYNPHGNFKSAMGGDSLGGAALNLLSFLGDLDSFLTGSTSGAHPDLIYLALLPSWPQAGFDKWRTVQRRRHVPGVLGSDVHQNVSVDPVCKGAMQVVCTAAAGGKPSALGLLISGGQLTLSDGRRLDAYERIMRWLHNRVLAKELDPTSVLDALRRGRSYGVFSVFGDPNGFAFEGAAAGAILDMGDEAKAPVALTVSVPPAPVPIDGGPPFDAVAAKTAEVRTVLFRTDANGTVEVASKPGLGASLTHTANDAGSYHVEVWMKPKHLASALGPEVGRADREYLWFLTNPIRVVK